MKARVIVPLNIRTGKPAILPDNNPNDSYLKPDTIVEIVDTITGEEYKGNDTWHKLSTGEFIWNGGISMIAGLPLFAPTSFIDSSKINTINTDWPIILFEINKIWTKYETFGKKAKIVILDTGFLVDHPLAFSKNITGWNYVKNDTDFTDKNGHGTNVASLITSFNDKVIGVAPEASVFIAKVKAGASSIQIFIDTLFLLSTFNNFDILSISYDYDLNNSDFKPFEKSFHDAIIANQKKIIITSAGNYSSNTDAFPAKFSEVLSIGAIDKNKKIAFDSNPSDTVTLSAPGVDLKCIGINNTVDLVVESGTSLSTPFVAGVAALLVSYAKSKHEEIETSFWNIPEIIKNSLDPPPTNQLGFGKGILNPEKCFDNLILKINSI